MRPRTPRSRDSERRLPLRGHLRELRRRLFISVAAVAVGTVAGWFFAPQLLQFLSYTIIEAGAKDGREASLNFIDVSSAFDLLVQVSVTTGIVVSSPIWITQLWGFFRPAMKRNEARMSGGFLIVAIPLFMAGCVAGAVLLPHIVEVMTGFANDGTTSQISARSYFDFVLKLIIAVGVAFALPVVLVFLNFGGVLTGKTMAKSWRIAILAITLFSAIATPAADVMSMFLLAAPMLLLYLTAVGIALMRDRRKALRAPALELV